MWLWLLFFFVGVVLSALLWVPRFVSRKQQGQYEASDRAEQNVQHYRSEVAQLKNRLEQGELSPKQFEQLETDLVTAMAEDVDAIQINQAMGVKASPGVTDQAQSNQNASKPSLALLVLMSLVLVLGSITVYYQIGSSNEIHLTQLLETSAKRELNSTEIQEVFARLEHELQRSPKDVELRFIQARMYFAKGEYGLAVDAFRKAVDQLPPEAKEDKAMALAQLAQADFFQHRQRLTDVGRAALKEAIQLNPQERTAIGLLGIDAFAQEQYRSAIRYWRQLQSLVGSSGNAVALEGGIQRAIEELKKRGEDVSELEMNTEKVKGKQLAVEVFLKAEADIQLKGTETLFVYAKPEGQPMPVAAKKIMNPTFPLKVVLSDSDSPMPTSTLSKQQKVVVTARLSSTGKVAPNKGDLEGQSVLVDLEQQGGEPIAIALMPIR